MDLAKIVLTCTASMFLSGCFSYPGSRMNDIVMPFSNVQRNIKDKEAKCHLESVFPYFNESMQPSLEKLQCRTATKEELDDATGRYFFVNGGIVFVDEQYLNKVSLERTLFHEIIHHLDYCGNINRLEFFSIYDKMSSTKYPIKDYIENKLNERVYRTDKWKDFQSERIAYTIELWFFSNYEVPKEMMKLISKMLKNDTIFKRLIDS